MEANFAFAINTGIFEELDVACGFRSINDLALGRINAIKDANKENELKNKENEEMKGSNSNSDIDKCPFADLIKSGAFKGMSNPHAHSNTTSNTTTTSISNDIYKY